MKRSSSFLVLLLLAASQLLGWPESDREKLRLEIGGAWISIEYGRPALKGRDMIGMLQKGQVWRLGMNRATVFETDKDLLIGDITLNPGRFSIFAKKLGDNEWNLIFNSEPDIWGTQRISGNDVAEIPVQASDLENPVEKFLITLVPTGERTAQLTCEWGYLSLRTDFTVMK